MSFKQIGSLIEKHKTKTSLLWCWLHNKSEVFVLYFLYRRFNFIETRQMGKVRGTSERHLMAAGVSGTSAPVPKLGAYSLQTWCGVTY